MKKLFLGSDHAGFHLKSYTKQFIIKQYMGIQIQDVGTYENKSCHYPDFAQQMRVRIKDVDKGILVCGSGIGIGIAMVKAGVSCSTCFNQYMAEQCGKVCQVMAVGERVVTQQVMQLMIISFLKEWVNAS